ncbi:unnamed protein product, partial [Polarella glacialis]
AADEARRVALVEAELAELVRHANDQLPAELVASSQVSGVQLSAVKSVLSMGSLQQAMSEGDSMSGLIFAVICLIVVGGIYLLTFASDQNSGDHIDGDESLLRVCPCFPLSSKNARASPAAPAGERLLDMRQNLPPVSQRTSMGVANMPMSTSQSLIQAWRPTQTAASPRPSTSQISRTARPDEWQPELPMIYPSLVMPVAHTRLAVPLSPLFAPQFEVDVLGLSGVPLLSASLTESTTGARN